MNDVTDTYYNMQKSLVFSVFSNASKIIFQHFRKRLSNFLLNNVLLTSLLSKCLELIIIYYYVTSRNIPTKIGVVPSPKESFIC